MRHSPHILYMAKSQITINAKEFINSLNKEQKEMHRDIMTRLTVNMDNIRKKAADKFIIPRRAGKPHGNLHIALRALYKMQPTDPRRLTERTGLLKDILKSNGTWSRSLRNMRLRASEHLLFWIKPQKEGSRYSYLMNLAIMPRGSKAVKNRIENEIRGSQSGVKRPFFEPAIMDEKDNINRSVSEFLNVLRKV